MLSIGNSTFCWQDSELMNRVWFRPRVLRDVSHVDFSTKILGFNSSMPVYITATALGELTL